MTDQDFMSNIMHQVRKMKGRALFISFLFFNVKMHKLVCKYRNENLKLGLLI